MLVRMQYCQNLESYVELLDKQLDTAEQINDAGCIRQALQAMLKVFPEVIEIESKRKIELHNELGRRLYLRAHRMVVSILSAIDLESSPVNNILNVRLKACSILKDHATKILDYTSAQLKYHDSLMGKLRAVDEKFVQQIDKELEFIK